MYFHGFLSTVNRSNNLRMPEGFPLMLPLLSVASSSCAGIWSLERPSFRTFSDSLASGKWTVCLLRIGTNRLYLLIFLLSSDIDSAWRLRADFHFSWNGVQGSDGMRMQCIHIRYLQYAVTDLKKISLICTLPHLTYLFTYEYIFLTRLTSSSAERGSCPIRLLSLSNASRILVLSCRISFSSITHSGA